MKNQTVRNDPINFSLNNIKIQNNRNRHVICFSLTFSATNVRGGVNRASMKYDRNG
jgi:hypothetical protein